MTWNIRATMTEVCFRANSDFSMDQTGSERIWSDGVSWLLGHVVSSYECQFLTITDAPTFSLVGACGGEVRRAELAGNFFFFMLVGRQGS